LAGCANPASPPAASIQSQPETSKPPAPAASAEAVPQESAEGAVAEATERGEGFGFGSGFGSGHGRLGGSYGPPRVGAHAVGPGAPGEAPVEPELPPTTVDPLARVQAVVDGFGSANIAFNPPKTMTMGSKKLVELLLSPKDTEAVLRAALPAVDQASAETASVQVAPRMEARLTGLGFMVESLAPSEQVVSRSQRTRWSWAVIPTEPGVQFLHLSLSARVDVDGHDTPFVVRTFDREIEVQVTAMQRAQALLSKHGSWVWGALVVPLFGYLWKRYKRKRKAESNNG